jgi:micrococcal nuclease
MLSTLIDRFRQMPTLVRVLFVVAALGAIGISVLLSPLMVALASLVLIVAGFVLIVQALRRRPLRSPAIVAAASLVILVLFTGISNALYSGGQPEQSSSPGPQNQTATPDAKPKPLEQAEKQKGVEQIDKKPKQIDKKPKEPEKGTQETPKDKQSKQDRGNRTHSDTNDTTVTVTRVVDGDTIEVSPLIDGTSDVRLIGVDTPETYSGEEPCGPEASEFTASRLEGERVRLEFDEDKFDPYDRLLAYVWLDGKMFNETLVKEGYASVSTFPPNDKYESRFLAAEATAPTLACSTPATATATSEATADSQVPATATATGESGAEGSVNDRLNNGIDDVNCSDLAGPIPTPPGDEDNLDADDDGTACD